MDHTFTDGQLAVQKITKEGEIAKMRIPMVKDSLHERFIPFLEYQILTFIGSQDSQGNLWSSLIVGERGFINAPSIHEITFDLSKIKSNKNDIFFKNIETNSIAGLLFHEAQRRARYRAWGNVTMKGNLLSFNINMGYPSCPKHIQQEIIELPKDLKKIEVKTESGTALNLAEKEWISNAHTFFIATQTKKGDIESSHRGGSPGFIEILENGHLRVPDYLGNSMFSTLGNIYENPKAALLFIDYKKGKTLQLSGLTKIEFNQNSEKDFNKSGETGRFWTFETKQWIKTLNHHQVNNEFEEFSPFNI